MTDTAIDRPSSSPRHPRDTDLVASPPPATVLSAQVSSAPPIPSAPAPSADVDLVAGLRLVENVLVTLATWEDADDSLVLPQPLAGQQALHGVRRLQDGLAQAGGAASPRPEDLALLERTVLALEAGLASGEEDICQAVAQYEECSLDAVSAVLATLAQLTPQGRLH